MVVRMFIRIEGGINMGYNGSAIRDASPLEQLIMWLRDDLVGELDAINQYQWHIDNIDNAEVKEVLAHIRDEEKEHVAELTKLIARIDEIQREKFLEDDHDHGDSSDDELVAMITGTSPVEGLTIGSLKGK